MELTIKELAAYLPYGLKVIKDGKIYGIDGLFSDMSMHLQETNRIDYFHYYPCVKPILYPLDYLTKEITHNGETFVPIERLFEFDYPENKSKKYYYDNQTNYIRCSHGNTTYHKMIYTNNELFGRNFFKDVEKLLEWKLDIFNLIENNLAIAVTEDFNPYK